MSQDTNWIEEAKKRIASEVNTVIADTPDKAKEFGVRLGDTVMIRNVRPIGSVSLQEMLDETLVRIHGL